MSDGRCHDLTHPHGFKGECIGPHHVIDGLSSDNNITPFLEWPIGLRGKLVDEIMRKADILASEGSIEQAEGMYDVGNYILTGLWEW